MQVPTMLRPIGGMSKIAEAIARSLAQEIRYGVEVTRLRRNERSGARVEFRERGRDGALTADHVIVTLPPGLLDQLDHDFTPLVREALAAPESTALARRTHSSSARPVSRTS